VNHSKNPQQSITGGSQPAIGPSTNYPDSSNVHTDAKVRILATKTFYYDLKAPPDFGACCQECINGLIHPMSSNKCGLVDIITKLIDIGSQLDTDHNKLRLNLNQLYNKLRTVPGSNDQVKVVFNGRSKSYRDWNRLLTYLLFSWYFNSQFYNVVNDSSTVTAPKSVLVQAGTTYASVLAGGNSTSSSGSSSSGAQQQHNQPPPQQLPPQPPPQNVPQPIPNPAPPAPPPGPPGGGGGGGPGGGPPNPAPVPAIPNAPGVPGVPNAPPNPPNIQDEIEVLDEPHASTVMNHQDQLVNILNYEVYNKVKFTYANWNIVFQLFTPGLKVPERIGYYKYMFALRERDTVLLPSTLISECVMRWKINDKSWDSVILMEQFVKHWVSQVTMPHTRKLNAVLYAVPISFLAYYAEMSKTDIVAKNYFSDFHRETLAIRATSVCLATSPFIAYKLHADLKHLRGAQSLVPFLTRFVRYWQWKTAELWVKIKARRVIVTDLKDIVVNLKNQMSQLADQIIAGWLGSWTFIKNISHFTSEFLKMFVLMAIVSPIVEEVWRTFLPYWASLLLFSMEVYGKSHVADRAFSVIFHTALTMIATPSNLWQRVCFHMVWNAASLIVQLDRIKEEFEKLTKTAPQPTVPLEMLVSKINDLPMSIVKIFNMDLDVYTHVLNRNLKVGCSYKIPSYSKVTKPIKNQRISTVPLLYNYRPVCYGSCFDNEMAALHNRVFKQTPIPDNRFLTGFTRWVKGNYRQIFPHTSAIKVRPASIQEYLRNSNAAPGVKKTILRAYTKLLDLGVTHEMAPPGFEFFKYRRRKCFVKVENNNWRNDLSTLDKAPRMIMGAAPEFIALTGPYFQSLQKHIKRDLNVSSSLIFTSGVDATKLASKLFSGVVNSIFENDVSSWDSSVSQQLLQLEMWLYEKFNCPYITLKLVKQNIKTRGVTTHGIRFKAPPMRKSGDPYTSLGNSLLNLLLHMYCLHLHFGWTVQQIKANVVIAVQGDDEVMTSSVDLRPVQFKQMFLLAGFKSDSIFRRTYLDAEFCSMHVLKVKEGHTFVPKTGKVLSKFGCFIDLPKKQDVVQTLRGVCLGFQHLANINPILHPLFKRIFKVPFVGEDKPAKREEWQVIFNKTTPTIETFYGFFHRYGLCDYTRFQTIFSQLNFNEQYHTNSLIKLIVDRDCDAGRVY